MNSQDNQREAILYAYMAGIIDGEGTIRIAKAKHKTWNARYNAAIGMGMTDKNVIQLFVKIFGSKMRIECIPNRKLIYRWGTSGSLAVSYILKKLLPYLRVKKKQAELVMRFCEDKQTTGFRRNKGLSKKELQWREEFYKKVKKLNH